MRAGELNKRIEIQRDKGEVQNGNGEKTPDFQTIDTVWAGVKPLAGREYFQAQQVQSAITHQVKLRYYPGLTTKDRFLYQGTRILNIDRAINIEEKNEEHLCMCIEAV
jgi:SPP1 family predicted phage head-tail adaptor